mmetsp:Transcript_66132/g.157820  ORF Transcript_66132/g.157820 Transcript_66132/m.157820 type:complete len:265 (+) Transcript_66132:385-1179(+)
MEVHRDRLHPSVIRVARIVNVPFVELLAVLEERIHLLFDRDLALRICVHCVQRLLPELPLGRHGHCLASVDHAARYGPLATVFALDQNHLQHPLPVIQGLPAGHDGVRRVVRPEVPEQPAPLHPRAPPGVLRQAIDDLVRPVVRGAVHLLRLHAVEDVELDLSKLVLVIRPLGLGEHRLRRVVRGGIFRPRDGKRDLVVRDKEFVGSARVLNLASNRVRHPEELRGALCRAGDGLDKERKERKRSCERAEPNLEPFELVAGSRR